MTSFLADTTAFVSHLPESVFALLATARPLMNCSIVPVILSTDELCDKLLSPPPFALSTEKNFLKLFSTFSDTMQFTKKIRLAPKSFVEGAARGRYVGDILLHLIESKRYFARTLQHLDFLSIEWISLLAGKLHNIETISLECCTHEFKDEHLEILCRNFTKIRELDIMFRAVGDVGLKSLSFLKSLETLNLSDIPVNFTSLHFLCDLKYLKKLNLSSCEELTDDAFDLEKYDADDNNNSDRIKHSSCQNNSQQPLLFSLEDINLSNCTSLSSVAFQHLLAHAPYLLSLECDEIIMQQPDAALAVSNMSNLQQLKLSAFGAADTSVSILSSSMSVLMKNLQNLVSLELNHASGLNDEMLSAISESSSPIRSLCFYRCDKVTNKGLRCLSAMPCLETLVVCFCQNPKFTGDIMSSIDDEVEEEGCVVSSSNRSFPVLKHLHLLGCHFLNDKGLLSIFEKSKNVNKQPLELKSLKVSFCTGVTSVGLKKALEMTNCKSTLEEVVLEFLYLDDLLFLSGFEGLKKADFSNCSIGNFFTVDCLSESPLEELSLRYTAIATVNLNTWPARQKWVRHLKKLDLSSCKNIAGDKLLLKIMPKLSALEYISISGHDSVSSSNSGTKNDGDNDESSDSHRQRFSAQALCQMCAKLPRLKKIAVSASLLTEIASDVELTKKYGYAMCKHWLERVEQ